MIAMQIANAIILMIDRIDNDDFFFENLNFQLIKRIEIQEF